MNKIKVLALQIHKVYARVLLPILNEKSNKSIQFCSRTIKSILNKEVILDLYVNNIQKQLKKISPSFIDEKWNNSLKRV